MVMTVLIWLLATQLVWADAYKRSGVFRDNLSATAASATSIPDANWTDDTEIGSIVLIDDGEDATGTTTATTESSTETSTGSTGSATDSTTSADASSTSASSSELQPVLDAVNTVSKNQQRLQRGQKQIATRHSTGFSTATSNQRVLKTNQSKIYEEVHDSKEEILHELQHMLDKDKLKGVLFGGGDDSDNKDEDNFLQRLQIYLSDRGRGAQASADISQATQAMLSLIDSPEYQAKSHEQMQEAIALIMSGAGNRYGKSYFSVSDVVPSEPDPFGTTAGVFEKMIYPLMIDTDGDGMYVAATCNARNRPADTNPALCNLMIGTEFTRLLVQSCHDDYKSSCDNMASGASSDSMPGAGGVTFDDGSYPANACGCMADIAFISERNETWNGWRPTLRAVLENYSRCAAFKAYNVPAKYADLASSVTKACDAFMESVNENQIQGYEDGSGNIREDFVVKAKSYLSTTLPLLKNISDGLKPLLFLQAFNNQAQSAKDPSVKTYGSLWGLIGPDSYQMTDDGSFSYSNTTNCIKTMNDYINDSSQFNVTTSLISNEDSGATKALLAELYVDQLLNNTRFNTVLDVPNLGLTNPQDGSAASCSAVIVKNGRFHCLANDGKAVKNASIAFDTTVSVSNVGDIQSNQSSVLNQLSTFSKTYQSTIAPLNIQKLFVISLIKRSFNERNIMLNVTPKSGGTTCSFTPMQALDFAMKWRLDPARRYKNADDDAVQARASYDAESGESLPLELDLGNFNEHLSASNVSEVLKEMAQIMQMNNYISTKLYKQQETLSLLLSLSTLSAVDTRRAELVTNSLMLKSMSKDFYRGSASVSSASTSGE